MVEAHRIANPGSGEGFFPINKTLIQTQPIRQDPPSTYCIVAYFIFTIYFTLSTVVEQQRAQSSWYQTSFVVWEVRRGVHDEIVSGGGGVTLLPLFFVLGVFLFRKGWESEKAFCLFWRGVIPPRRKSWKMRTAAALLALTISFAGLPHPRSNRPSRRQL